MTIGHTQPPHLVNTCVKIKSIEEYLLVLSLYKTGGGTKWPWHKGYQTKEEMENNGTEYPGYGLYGLEECGFLKHLHNVAPTAKELTIVELMALVYGGESSRYHMSDANGITMFTTAELATLITNITTTEGRARVREIISSPHLEKYYLDFPLNEDYLRGIIDPILTDSEVWTKEKEETSLLLYAIALLIYTLCGYHRTHSSVDFITDTVKDMRTNCQPKF